MSKLMKHDTLTWELVNIHFWEKKVLHQLLKHTQKHYLHGWQFHSRSNRQGEGSIILHKSYNVCIEFGLFLIRICWVVKTSLWIEHQLEKPMLLRMEKTTSRHGPMWKGVAFNPKRANALSPFKGFSHSFTQKTIPLKTWEFLKKHACKLHVYSPSPNSLTHSLLLYQIA